MTVIKLQAKPLPHGAVAVLVVNRGDSAATVARVSVQLSDLPWPKGKMPTGSISVRD